MAELPTIHECLAKVKAGVGAVGKNERNTMQNFSFRGIDSTVNACAPLLNEHGVITVPTVLEHDYSTVEVGAKRTSMSHVILKVRYDFIGPRGDAVSATVMSESMDSGDKAMAKAMSVAYRIALLQTLNLPTDEADPDSVSYERSSRADQEAAQKPAGRPIISGTIKVNPAQEKPATDVVGVDVSALVQKIKDATTADQLNAVFKQAGALGMLQKEGAVGVTIQQMLYDRNDAIKSNGSAGSSPGRKAAAAK